MIDVSQWRASVGLWNYCQAASSRPANGHHSHSLKATVDSKPCSTPGENQIVGLFLIAFLCLSMLIWVLAVNGKLANMHSCAVIINFLELQSYTSCRPRSGSSVMNFKQVPAYGDNSFIKLFAHDILLLSGDVELNPGPVTGKQAPYAMITINLHLQVTQGKYYRLILVN